MRYRSWNRAGFTLIELLAVISVMTLLVSILLPAIQSAREASRRLSCQNNLKQLGLGVQGYMNDTGYLPPGSLHHRLNGPTKYFNMFSVLVRMLPYMEQVERYNSINFLAGTLALTIEGDLVRPEVIRLNSINSTSSNATMQAFLCPSYVDTSTYYG